MIGANNLFSPTPKANRKPTTCLLRRLITLSFQIWFIVDLFFHHIIVPVIFWHSTFGPPLRRE